MSKYLGIILIVTVLTGASCEIMKFLIDLIILIIKTIKRLLGLIASPAIAPI